VLTLAQTRDIKSDQRQQTKTTLPINQSVFEFQKSRDRRQAREKSVWSKTRLGLVSLLLVEKQCVWFDCLKRFNNNFLTNLRGFLTKNQGKRKIASECQVKTALQMVFPFSHQKQESDAKWNTFIKSCIYSRPSWRGSRQDRSYVHQTKQIWREWLLKITGIPACT